MRLKVGHLARDGIAKGTGDVIADLFARCSWCNDVPSFRQPSPIRFNFGCHVPNCDVKLIRLLILTRSKQRQDRRAITTPSEGPLGSLCYLVHVSTFPALQGQTGAEDTAAQQWEQLWTRWKPQRPRAPVLAAETRANLCDIGACQPLNAS